MWNSIFFLWNTVPLTRRLRFLFTPLKVTICTLKRKVKPAFDLFHPIIQRAATSQLDFNGSHESHFKILLNHENILRSLRHSRFHFSCHFLSHISELISRRYPILNGNILYRTEISRKTFYEGVGWYLWMLKRVLVFLSLS